MSEIRKFEIGSDDDELTPQKIQSLPTADNIPKGSVKVSSKDPYYANAHKNGYKVHFHEPTETAYLHKTADTMKQIGATHKEHEGKDWK